MAKKAPKIGTYYTLPPTSMILIKLLKNQTQPYLVINWKTNQTSNS